VVLTADLLAARTEVMATATTVSAYATKNTSREGAASERPLEH